MIQKRVGGVPGPAVGGCAVLGAAGVAVVLMVALAITSVTRGTEQLLAALAGQCEQGDQAVLDDRSGGAATDRARGEIPADYLELYKTSGREWNVDWALLAAVGWKESRHGSDPNSRTENGARALGPMQFTPPAWKAHGLRPGDKSGDKGRPPLDARLDPATAIWSAAHKLTDQGARTNPYDALVAYYGADVDGYASSVLDQADAYREGGVRAAEDAGGGDGPRAAIDCSGGDGPGTAPDYQVGDLRDQSRLEACQVTDSPFATGPITPLTCAAHEVIVDNFGDRLTHGGNCKRAYDDGGEHFVGRACDYMVSPGGSMPDAEQGALGDDIAGYAKEHHAELGVKYVIWKQRIWNPERADEGWRDMKDRGSVTQNHHDHVHISFVP